MERGLENDNVLFSTEFKRKWASPVAQLVKESTCNAGDMGSIPGLG